MGVPERCSLNGNLWVALFLLTISQCYTLDLELNLWIESM